MKKQLQYVVPQDKSWRVAYDLRTGSGPESLECEGQEIMRKCRSFCDELSDDLLLPDKVRFFRKAGTSMVERQGHFPFGAGLIIRQVHRHDVNTLRTTTDISWKPATPLKDKLQLQSFQLVGTWTRFLALTSGDDDVVSGDWQELPSSGELTIVPAPLAVVFERADGMRLEAGKGNDLWRWQNGLCLHESDSSSLKICVQEKCVTVTRILEIGLPAPAGGEEPVCPEPRQFRFNSYFAWGRCRCPQESIGAQNGDNSGRKLLSIDVAQGLSAAELSAVGDSELQLDFASLALAWAESSLTKNGVCLDAPQAQKLLRRVGRQLAEIAVQSGRLCLLGLSPVICRQGKHCERQKPTTHWSHAAILEYCAWLRQRLGQEWIIRVPQSGIWQQLPSLARLGDKAQFSLES